MLRQSAVFQDSVGTTDPARGRVKFHLWLLLQIQGRPADSLRLEINSDLDPVSDLDEGNAFVHPVLLAVEGHRPLNGTRACPSARNRDG